MRFLSYFNFFLTWWGAMMLGALDSSLFFFVPFSTDAVVVYLSARDRSLFWVYPLMATVGSIAGASVTYAIGATIGEKGLSRFVSERRLKRARERVQKIGLVTLGLSALLPPPFPMTAFVLTSGALEVGAIRFLLVFAGARLVRFGIEAMLARRYGVAVLRLLESDLAQQIVIALLILSIVGTAFAVVRVFQAARR